MRVLGVCLASTLAVLNLMLVLSASAQDSKPEFSVLVSAPVTTVADPRQLSVSITLTNTSGHAIEFEGDGSDGGANFLVDVFDAAGKLAPESNWLRAVRGEAPEPGSDNLIYGVGSDSDLVLKPGEKGVFPIRDICTLYRLTPGEYTLAATGHGFQFRPGVYVIGLTYYMNNQRDPKRTEAAKASLSAKSNILSFTITTESCPDYWLKRPKAPAK